MTSYLGQKSILDSAIKVLSKYYLCDRCLGRLFARLSMGWTNKERGEIIKKALVMELHRQYLEGKVDAELFKLLLSRLSPYSNPLMHELGIYNIETDSCYICNNEIENIIFRLIKDGVEILKEEGLSKFIIGVKSEGQFSIREEEVNKYAETQYSESIRNELKREIGKGIAKEGFYPEFEVPEVSLILDLSQLKFSISHNMAHLLTNVKKKKRGITLSEWAARNRQSIEGRLKEILKEHFVKYYCPITELPEQRVIFNKPMIIVLKSHKDLGLITDRLKGEGEDIEFKVIKEVSPTVSKRFSTPSLVKGSLYKMYIKCSGLKEVKELFKPFYFNCSEIMNSIWNCIIELPPSIRFNNIVENLTKRGIEILASDLLLIYLEREGEMI